MKNPGLLKLSLPATRLLMFYKTWQALQKGGLKQAVKEGLPLSIVLAILSYTFGGPRHSLISRMIGIESYSHSFTCSGEVSEGFENVRRAFENNFKNGLERGAQFVVYHRGQKVVDLYGSIDDELPGYNGDSIQVCFSCSKVLTSIVVALAVDKGYLDYDEKVCTYWPEFAANGKQDIKVSDVLRHDGGLAYFEEMLPIELCHRESMNELADFIADAAPHWEWENDAPNEPNSRMYHGMSRGLILNVLIRLTDPGHRTVGQIIREELAEPHGQTIVMGKPTEEERSKLFDLKFEPIPAFLMRMLWVALTGQGDKDEQLRDFEIVTKNKDSNVLKALAPIKMPWYMLSHDNFHSMNHPIYHHVEMPSANSLSNAKAFGKLADLMSRKKLLSTKTHELAHSDPVTKYDYGIHMDTTFTKGGLCMFEDEGWDDMFKGFVGWGGYGGSMFAWNQETETGIAYTMNGTYLKSVMGFKDERCKYLMRETLKSIQKLTPSKSNL